MTNYNLLSTLGFQPFSLDSLKLLGLKDLQYIKSLLEKGGACEGKDFIDSSEEEPAIYLNSKAASILFIQSTPAQELLYKHQGYRIFREGDSSALTVPTFMVAKELKMAEEDLQLIINSIWDVDRELLNVFDLLSLYTYSLDKVSIPGMEDLIKKTCQLLPDPERTSFIGLWSNLDNHRLVFSVLDKTWERRKNNPKTPPKKKIKRLKPVTQVKSNQGYIYVLDLSNAIKVGFSINVDNRIKQHKTSNKFVELLAVFPATFKQEKAFHKKYNKGKEIYPLEDKETILENIKSFLEAA